MCGPIERLLKSRNTDQSFCIRWPIDQVYWEKLNFVLRNKVREWEIEFGYIDIYGGVLLWFFCQPLNLVELNYVYFYT